MFLKQKNSETKVTSKFQTFIWNSVDSYKAINVLGKLEQEESH